VYAEYEGSSDPSDFLGAASGVSEFDFYSIYEFYSRNGVDRWETLGVDFKLLPPVKLGRDLSESAWNGYL
jgi:hypothetical protein